MFRFTIRDVLWLTVVVGLAGCDHKTRTIRQGVDDVTKHAAKVEQAAKGDNTFAMPEEAR